MKPILILANLKSHFDALEKCLSELRMPHYPQGYYLSRDILKNMVNKEEFVKLCEENLYSGVIISFPESDESRQTNLMKLEYIAKANALPIIFLCNIERGYLYDAPSKENFLFLGDLNLQLPLMLISKGLILVK